MSRPNVEIKNTRVVKVSENPVAVQGNEMQIEELADVDCVIEFMMLTNYYGDSYPFDTGVYDSVVVYKDGTMEIPLRNLLITVMDTYFLTDYTGIIEEITDLGDAYNGKLFSPDRHTIRVMDEEHVIEEIPESALAGEKVSVITCFVTDGEVIITVNGADIGRFTEENVYEFVMPDEDVEVRGWVSTEGYPGA